MSSKPGCFLYGGIPAEVTPAAGITGLLLRDAGGGATLRVRAGDGFIDYEIRHDDLRVTIDPDELAAFYKVGDDNILDHDPQVLGLRKISEE